MGAPLVGSNVGSAVGSLVLLVGSVIASGEGSEVGLAVGGSVSEDEYDARSGTSSFPPASSTLASSDTSSRCPGATVHSSSLRARHMHRQGGATATRALGEAPRPSAQPRFRSGSLAGRGELARRPRQRVYGEVQPEELGQLARSPAQRCSDRKGRAAGVRTSTSTASLVWRTRVRRDLMQKARCKTRTLDVPFLPALDCHLRAVYAFTRCTAAVTRAHTCVAATSCGRADNNAADAALEP